jgi:hypothetical protein
MLGFPFTDYQHNDSPAGMLYAYKNMECSVAGGTAVVSVNRYKNANHAPEKSSSCKTALTVSYALHGVGKDVYSRAGGQEAYVDVFSGKGSPSSIAAVLESFWVYADRFVAKHGKDSKGSPTGKVASFLSDDDLTWEQALQKICDEYIGLDCNGFVGNWLKKVAPELKLNQHSKADPVRAQAKKYRASVSEIENWDVMCYAKNEHIAAVQCAGNRPGSFIVCQSAGGGPRMNEFGFLPAGRDKNGARFKLAAPTKNDIGFDFYVVSLW